MDNRTKNALDEKTAHSIKNAAARKKLEADIKVLEDEILSIENAMSTDGIGYDDLNKLYYKLESLKSELDRMMEKWLELQPLE